MIFAEFLDSAAERLKSNKQTVQSTPECITAETAVLQNRHTVCTQLDLKVQVLRTHTGAQNSY